MDYRNWLLGNATGKIARSLIGLAACGAMTAVATANSVHQSSPGLQTLAAAQAEPSTSVTTGTHLLDANALSHRLIGQAANLGSPASLRDGDSGDKGDGHADGDKGDKGDGHADGDNGDKGDGHADGDKGEKGEKGDKDHHDGDDDGNN